MVTLGQWISYTTDRYYKKLNKTSGGGRHDKVYSKFYKFGNNNK